MKTNKNLPLNWRQMPILRTLVLVQVGIAIVFSIISAFVAIYYINERSTAVLNSRRLDVTRIMSQNQERIRLWASLEMSEALDISLRDIRNIDFVKSVEVKRLSTEKLKKLKSKNNILVIPTERDANLPYYLVFKISKASTEFSALFIPLIVFIFTFTLIYFSIFFIIRKIFKPLSLLITDDALNIEASGEIGVLISKIQRSQADAIQLQSEKNNFKLATQLAHDIRSPLEVLKGLKDEMMSFPDSSRKRIQLSINRIEEITFNLLKSHKQTSGIALTSASEELLSLITSVVMEKNIEYRNREGVEIQELFDSSSYGLFSNIQRSSLKSILSNLINNGIQSFDGISGTIKVNLVSSENQNVIYIIDNGSGISPDLITNIFTRGFTTKISGNGLGLYNAKKDIEAAGGTIKFESFLGNGTTFTISLPKSEMPATFISSINAFKYERIIVLDDDPAFHEVWNKRLEGLESKVEHIHSVEEMLSKYQALHPKILLLSDFELMDKQYDGIDTILKLNHAQNSILVTARSEEQAIQDRCLKYSIKLLPKSLVNYVKVVKELSESSQAQVEPSSGMVGEDLAVEYNGPVSSSKASKFDQVVGNQGREGESCTLYVDHADRRSSDIQDGKNQKPASAGEAYGIYIEGGVPRSNETELGQNHKAIILIDDDKLVRLNWASHCKKKELPFQAFASIADFLASSSSIDKSSKIYIDSNLGDGIVGEIESEKIHALGFLELYLATGYEKESIKKPVWIKEIYSKSPENIR